jgi:hypothetical protein
MREPAGYPPDLIPTAPMYAIFGCQKLEASKKPGSFGGFVIR